MTDAEWAQLSALVREATNSGRSTGGFFKSRRVEIHFDPSTSSEESQIDCNIQQPLTSSDFRPPIRRKTKAICRTPAHRRTQANIARDSRASKRISSPSTSPIPSPPPPPVATTATKNPRNDSDEINHQFRFYNIINFKLASKPAILLNWPEIDRQFRGRESVAANNWLTLLFARHNITAAAGVNPSLLAKWKWAVNRHYFMEGNNCRFADLPSSVPLPSLQQEFGI